MNQSDKSEPANNVEIANSVGVDSKGVHNLQLYAEIVNNMQVGICVWQWVNPLDITAFKLIASNPFAEQLTNRPLRTLIGQRIQDCFPNISRENLELFVRVIRSKQSESQPELDYSDEFAPESFYSYKAFPLPEQCVGVALENITECQLSQRLLQESEERFRATFEQAAVGIAHVDLDGRWLRANQKLCDILGYTREELLMQKFQDITYPDDLESDLQSIRQLLTLEIQTYSMKKRYIHRDGSPIWVYLTVSLVSSESQPKYFLSVIEEIGDRKQAELVLQERANELTRLNTILAQTTTLLNKRKQEMDQFAYVASHDLKAPLRAIANLSVFLEEDLSGQLPPENLHQLQLLRGRVNRMEGLINGLLEYSRVGRTQSAIQTVNVAELLSEIIDSLAPPSTFSIEIAPGMPTLKTQRLLLMQVFANLLSNAIKHHDRLDGHIKISVKDLARCYQFSVTDDGPGIASEYHEKIFTIFQTLQAGDTKENTGIGLSIVKKIVETEGGTIRVKSQSGLGATFCFTWPK